MTASIKAGLNNDMYFMTDGVTRASIDSAGNTNIVNDLSVSGNVGIGTTSPSSYFSPDLVVSAGNLGGITIAAEDTTNTNYLMFADGTSGSAAYRGYINYTHNSPENMLVTSHGYMRFYTGSTPAERMKIDENGYITKPYQPAFAAYSPAVTTSGNYVVFGSTYSNIGSHYDTSNGRFTAPVAGTYFFGYNILMGNPYTGSYVRVVFRVNGQSVGYTLGDTLSDVSASQYKSVHNTAVFTMAANDYIQVYNEGIINTYGANYGNFGGFLIG